MTRPLSISPAGVLVSGLDLDRSRRYTSVCGSKRDSSQNLDLERDYCPHDLE
jgi:hypothetical protein